MLGPESDAGSVFERLTMTTGGTDPLSPKNTLAIKQTPGIGIQNPPNAGGQKGASAGKAVRGARNTKRSPATNDQRPADPEKKPDQNREPKTSEIAVTDTALGREVAGLVTAFSLAGIDVRGRTSPASWLGPWTTRCSSTPSRQSSSNS